jgi:tetratricopeptide (TPR) repeat protein
MNHRHLRILFVLLCIAHLTFAGNLKRVLRAIEKQDYEKVFELLREEITDEPFNPGAYYIYANLLSTDSLPFYHPREARNFILTAIEQYDTASTSVQQDLEKVSISYSDMERIYDRIKIQILDSAFYDNTVESYNTFLSYYPASKEADTVIFIRDSLVFEEVKMENTWQAYKNYMDTYPLSRYKPIASVRYQRLLYIDRTRSGSLEDLERFIKTHPDNPYNPIVTEEIFKKRMSIAFLVEADSGYSVAN